MAGERTTVTDVEHQSQRSEHAWRILDAVRDWTKHAETKAATTLAASGVVGGVLYSLVTGGDDRSPWFTVAVAVSALCSVSAGVTAGLVLLPRQRLTGSALPTSLLFYHHITRECATGRDYGDRLNELLRDEDALVTAVADQIWATAVVAGRKYRWVGRSIALLLLAVVAVAVAAVVSAVG